MIFKQQNLLFTRPFLFIFIIIVGTVLISACENTNKLDPAVKGPQLIVNPDSINLGIAKVMSTDIVFEGAGFPPNDSVFISLAGPGDTNVVVADGKINPDGSFQAKISPLAKVTGILKANITGTYSKDGTYNQIVVITQEPIPAGAYTAVATCMLSDQKAETKFTVRRPMLTDRIKDWLGKKAGKIQLKK